MDGDDIFGYGSAASNDTVAADAQKPGDNATNIVTGKLDHDVNGVPVDDITGSQSTGDANQQANADADSNKNADAEKNDNLEKGTSVEVDGETYTVDDAGNLLDKNGNIYKEASQVKDWLASFEKVEDGAGDTISISSIQDAIGVQITDDKDKPVEFENNAAGVKAYVDAVIETAKEEHFEAAINTLYQKYPILEDVLNYYVANGNSLEGFNELPDRSGIVVEDGNEAQQEAIVRAAWKEQNRKGDVDSYIAYLKTSGSLLASAKEELEAMQEADKQLREQLAAEAEKEENERIKNLENYWNGVHDVVKSRNIAGYQIPESIIINRNGQKLSVTPEDFFNYIYRVDENGKSAYERDLAAETPESRRDDEILRAYLKFVGGNYSNLVDMAVNKQNVATLRFKAKERSKPAVRIVKPQSTGVKGADIDFGYN